MESKDNLYPWIQKRMWVLPIIGLAMMLFSVVAIPILLVMEFWDNSKELTACYFKEAWAALFIQFK